MIYDILYINRAQQAAAKQNNYQIPIQGSL